MPDRCRSCKAPIRWATTEHGRSLPLDPEPSVQGTIRLDPPAGAAPTAIVVPEGDRGHYAGRLFVTHFVTCPFATEHRR